MIKKAGKPVAVTNEVHVSDRIHPMSPCFDTLCQRIEAGYVGTAQAQGMDEILAAVQQDRLEQRQRLNN